MKTLKDIEYLEKSGIINELKNSNTYNLTLAEIKELLNYNEDIYISRQGYAYGAEIALDIYYKKDIDAERKAKHLKPHIWEKYHSISFGDYDIDESFLIKDKRAFKNIISKLCGLINSYENKTIDEVKQKCLSFKELQRKLKTNKKQATTRGKI